MVDSATTNSNGIAEVTVSLSEGEYTWFAMAEKDGYTSDTSTTRTITRVKLYTLSLDTDYGETYGSGKYPRGTLVYFGVSEIIDQEDTRYIFDGWTSTNQGGYSGGDSSAMVTLDNDISETAVWKTQYYLDINSELQVDGEGWYDEGTKVTLRAYGLSKGLIIPKVFSRWSGDVPFSLPTGTITMDKPKTVTTILKNDYSRVIIGGGGILLVGLIVSWNNARKRKTMLFAQKREDLKELIRKELGGFDPIILSSYTDDGNSFELVKEVISEIVEKDSVDGLFVKDGSVYVTHQSVQYAVSRLVEEEDTINVSKTSLTLGVPSEVVVGALNSLMEKSSLSGFFLKNGSEFVKQETLRENIRKRLEE